MGQSPPAVDCEMNSSEGNQSFRGDEPTWANAFGGENGLLGILDYDGDFASAENALIDAVIAGQASNCPVDTLIHPVCLSMRYAAELLLKATPTGFMALADIRQTQRGIGQRYVSRGVVLDQK